MECTPPADLEDFALGFALTEGLVRRAGDVEAVRLGEAAGGRVAKGLAEGLSDSAGQAVKRL